MQHSMDVAGSMILTIASRTQQTPEPYHIPTGLESPKIEGPVDNISPAALFQHNTISTGNPEGPQIEPASLALSSALAFKIIDICDTLATAEPPNKVSHHRLLFLKRLDLSIVQIRSALSLIQRHGVTRASLSNDAMSRAVAVQERIQSAMKDAFKLNLF